MSHEDHLQPEELDMLKAKFNPPPREPSTVTEMRDLETIESLISTKTQTAQAMDKRMSKVK